MSNDDCAPAENRHVRQLAGRAFGAVFAVLLLTMTSGAAQAQFKGCPAMHQCLVDCTTAVLSGGTSRDLENCNTRCLDVDDCREGRVSQRGFMREARSCAQLHICLVSCAEAVLNGGDNAELANCDAQCFTDNAQCQTGTIATPAPPTTPPSAPVTPNRVFASAADLANSLAGSDWTYTWRGSQFPIRFGRTGNMERLTSWSGTRWSARSGDTVQLTDTAGNTMTLTFQNASQFSTNDWDGSFSTGVRGANIVSQNPPVVQQPPVQQPPVQNTQLIQQIQWALQSANCNPGSADGVWGQKSITALQQFSFDTGIALPAQQISRRTLAIVQSRNGNGCVVAAVPPPQNNDTFGAIAYSTLTGDFGWSNKRGSQAQAEHAALVACQNHSGGGGCVNVHWVRNACTALATGDNRGFAAAWDNSISNAEQKAINTCHVNTTNCTLATSFCSYQ